MGLVYLAKAPEGEDGYPLNPYDSGLDPQPLTIDP